MAISKRHPFSHPCIAAFSKVFRYPEDHGENRTMSTPSPDMIKKNLDDFLSQWKDIAYDKKPVLSSQALQQIVKLKVHIQKGCLSGIPPGCGTERNECMHKFLRHLVSRPRIGVRLAIALLSTLLYTWNAKRSMSGGMKVIPAVQAFHSNTGSGETCENFGVGISAAGPIPQNTLPSLYTSTNSPSDLSSMISISIDKEVVNEILNEIDYCLDTDDVVSFLTKTISFYVISSKLTAKENLSQFDVRQLSCFMSHCFHLEVLSRLQKESMKIERDKRGGLKVPDGAASNT